MGYEKNCRQQLKQALDTLQTMETHDKRALVSRSQEQVLAEKEMDWMSLWATNSLNEKTGEAALIVDSDVPPKGQLQEARASLESTLI